MGFEKFNVTPENTGGRPPKEEKGKRDVEGEPYHTDVDDQEFWNKVWVKLVGSRVPTYEDIAEVAGHTYVSPSAVIRNVYENDVYSFKVQKGGLITEEETFGRTKEYWEVVCFSDMEAAIRAKGSSEERGREDPKVKRVEAAGDCDHPVKKRFEVVISSGLAEDISSSGEMSTDSSSGLSSVINNAKQ